MKLKPYIKIPLISNSVITLFALIIVFLIYFDVHHMTMPSEGLIFIGAVLVVAIIYTILLIVKTEYLLMDDTFTYKAIFKSMTYDYKDVIFIADQHAIKGHHLTIYFYDGRSLALVTDKENTLGQELKKRCPQTIDETEFHNRYPGIKL